jgi:hypothetical protein
MHIGITRQAAAAAGLAFTIGIGFAGGVSAEGTAFQSATFTGAGDNLLIDSFTTGQFTQLETTYTNLVGATVTNAPASGTLFRADQAVSPLNENVALSGLTISDGTVQTTHGTNFQLGGPIGDDPLFLILWNSNGGADLELGLIDAAGNRIGDYSSFFTDVAKLGQPLRSDTLVYEGGGSFFRSLYGVVFSVSDFEGTTGDTSLATGVTLLDSFPSDGDIGFPGDTANLAVVGRVIPEPASLGLLAVPITIGLSRRRRHSAR